LKPSSHALSLTALLLAAVFAASTSAQAPQATPPAAPAEHEDHHDHAHTAPTNLKVLPKDMTGEEVHELMEKWEADLGGKCSTCHAADPTNIGPNGRPRLNYADDSKPEKATARLMFTMTEEINSRYIAHIDSSGQPVTCGTCHRGHLGPEPFATPDDDGPKPPAAATAPAPAPAPAK